MARKMSEKTQHIPFDCCDDSTLTSQGAGKTVEKPLKGLPWNHQNQETIWTSGMIKYDKEQ